MGFNSGFKGLKMGPNVQSVAEQR